MRKLLLSTTALSLLLLCGCQTVQDARDVQQNKQPVIGEYTPKASDFGITPDKQLSLEELQLIALQIHPTIRNATNNVDNALLNIQMVKADFLPTLNAGASYSRATSNSAFNKHHQTTSNHGAYSGTLNLQLMIYDFGKTDTQVKQLAEIYKASLMELKAAQNTVLSNVRTAYFKLNRTIELDLVAKQTVKQYQEHRDQVKTKKEVGAGTSYDLTKAEVDVYNAILDENVTRNNIDIARAALMKAIGFAETSSFNISNASLKEYSLNMDTLLELANAGNPTLAMYKTLEDAASIYVDKTIADLYPTFSLSLNATAASHGSDPGLPWIWNLTGAASVAQNIFNGGRNMIAIKQAALELKNARSNRTNYEQVLFMNLRNASLNAQLAQEQYKVALEVEKQSQEYFDLVSAQYSVGKSTALERTDAQVALSDSQAKVVSAKYDYQDSLATIASLIGDLPTEKPVADKPEQK